MLNDNHIIVISPLKQAVSMNMLSVVAVLLHKWQIWVEAGQILWQ